MQLDWPRPWARGAVLRLRSTFSVACGFEVRAVATSYAPRRTLFVEWSRLGIILMHNGPSLASRRLLRKVSNYPSGCGPRRSIRAVYAWKA